MRRTPRLAVLVLIAAFSGPAAAQEAREIVRAAWESWRGTTSYGEMTMVIHRPTWERTMSMRAWTKGQKESLVRVTAPKKDVGNGTLMLDQRMWSFSPKVNRVIKVPSSMMGQGWMGSDFSNKDVSRSDEIVDDYDHTLAATEEHDGHTVYVIEAVPHEDAAVVWGQEVLRIRDDDVLVRHEFYDQDGVLVKVLRSTEIGGMGGRVIAIVQRMEAAGTAEEWTEVRMESIEFDLDLADRLFTQSNLRNPRE